MLGQQKNIVGLWSDQGFRFDAAMRGFFWVFLFSFLRPFFI